MKGTSMSPSGNELLSLLTYRVVRTRITMVAMDFEKVTDDVCQTVPTGCYRSSQKQITAFQHFVSNKGTEKNSPTPNRKKTKKRVATHPAFEQLSGGACRQPTCSSPPPPPMCARTLTTCTRTCARAITPVAPISC